MTSQPTKKLINGVQHCVDEAIEGLVAMTQGIVKLAGHRVIIREDLEDVKKSGKVMLLSGGGSGHEPAHAGYIGRGMLTGAVPGSVFTSPPASSILAAIQAVSRGNPAGTLLIVKNYTGDCLNFGIAMERARAEGITVDMVVVRDDCALTGQGLNDRRGLAGTVFIHKLAGAMAENGQTLAEIKQAVEAAGAGLGTVGVSLYPCSVPGAGPSFSLGPREIGLGLGIHGEAGIKTLELHGADNTVSTMLDHMMSSTNGCRLDCQSGDSVAVMINNLGGTTSIELCIVARATLQYLEKMGVRVERIYCGTFVTSLEMQGVSLTLLKLDKEGTLIACLDQETLAGGWPMATYRRGNITVRRELEVVQQSSSAGSDQTVADGEKGSVNAEEFGRLKRIVMAVCDKLVDSVHLLNDLDTSSGDGDCGSTMGRGAEVIRAWLETREQPLTASGLAHQMSLIAEEDMGGTSGAFYGLFLLAAQRALSPSSGAEPGFAEWVDALKQGMDIIITHGRANVGDRTMLDPMDAAYRILVEGVDSNRSPMETFGKAVKAAEKTAKATSTKKARAGRARYVNPNLLVKPDPGATAFAIWLRVAYEAMKDNTE